MERFVKNDSFNCGRVEEKKKIESLCCFDFKFVCYKYKFINY